MYEVECGASCTGPSRHHAAQPAAATRRAGSNSRKCGSPLRPLASGEHKTRSCRATPRVECAERPPIARESKCQFSPRLELVRSDEISHPAATAGEKHSCTRGTVFETRRACLRRFVGGTFPFAKTHKHLDTRLSEHARSHIAARLQAAGPSHQGPHDWIERRGSMPRVILRSDT